MARRGCGLGVWAVAVAVAAAPSTARADWELWLPVELRVPVARAPTPTWGRVDWRVVAEARSSGRTEGVETLFFRTGPVVYLAPFFFVGAHVTFAADALASTTGPVRMEEELRAELEPTFFGRLGPLTLVNRNRVEYRWRQTFQRVRARTQLRVNYAPSGWRVLPFVQHELLFDLTDTRLDDPTTAASVSPTPGLGQTRSYAGVGLQLWANVRVDVALLVRTRLAAAGGGSFDTTVDLGPWVQLFVDVPPAH